MKSTWTLHGRLEYGVTHTAGLGQPRSCTPNCHVDGDVTSIGELASSPLDLS